MGFGTLYPYMGMSICLFICIRIPDSGSIIVSVFLSPRKRKILRIIVDWPLSKWAVSDFLHICFCLERFENLRLIATLQPSEPVLTASVGRSPQPVIKGRISSVWTSSTSFILSCVYLRDKSGGLWTKENSRFSKGVFSKLWPTRSEHKWSVATSDSSKLEISFFLRWKPCNPVLTVSVRSGQWGSSRAVIRPDI